MHTTVLPNVHKLPAFILQMMAQILYYMIDQDTKKQFKASMMLPDMLAVRL